MLCPGCQHDVTPSPVGFTWWGGLLGSKLLKHVECPKCRVRFNGTTGRSNNTAIAMYLMVAGLLAVIVGYTITRGH